MRKAVKTRLEAAETLVPDLAKAYRSEARLIESFLPETLPPVPADELERIARELASAPDGPTKMGPLVQALRQRVGEDRVDGKAAAVAAKRALAK